MSNTTEETNISSHTTNSPANIASWWNKFHFSGRVIMCSVLFGFGLILIGGLIFAINMDDDSNKNMDDDISDQLPTKAPSNYVGPVVMGIGGFIVIVGVIMCLFETQVCRKKTGDSRPLIPGTKEDPEGNVSEPAIIPESSHSHKNHKHKSRKTSSSPRKSKSKHAKSHSHEHSHQKSSSSKSPPVTIDKEKGFMTSSEDKFLTPPNTLDEQAAVECQNTDDAENKESSLMQSFTSSGPSWNQSAEFLTPSTSFKDTSISLENSVEIDEKQGQVNFKTSELPEKECLSPQFMTPLTVEEDRIQKIFIRVKNEQKEKARREMEEKESSINMDVESGIKRISSSIHSKTDKENNKMSKNSEDVSLPTKELSSAIPHDATLKDTSGQRVGLDTDQIKENTNSDEENFSNVKGSGSNKDLGQILNENERLEMNIQADEKENFPVQEKENQESSPAHGSSTSPMNDIKDNSKDIKTSSDNINENDVREDLESSASSDETVVPPDNDVEQPKDSETGENAALLKEDYCSIIAEEDCNNQSKILNFPAPEIKPAESTNDHQNVPSSTLKVEEAIVHDLGRSEIDAKMEETVEKTSAETSSS